MQIMQAATKTTQNTGRITVASTKEGRKVPRNLSTQSAGNWRRYSGVHKADTAIEVWRTPAHLLPEIRKIP
jgi:hypothetical protein